MNPEETINIEKRGCLPQKIIMENHYNNGRNQNIEEITKLFKLNKLVFISN